MTDDYTGLPDELHEECGVAGVWGVENASGVVFMALQALQHRGQQGCGIASADSGGSIRLLKETGLVKDVFTDRELAGLPGNLCIGHVRYPTSDVGGRENLQPFVLKGETGPFALAHNGNIINSREIQASLEAHGHLFHTTSDSEMFAHLIAMELAHKGMERAIMSAANMLDGAFSAVVMTGDTLYACRDRYGFRPLSLGRLGKGYVVASETCALETVGAEFLRDLEAGELISIRGGEVTSYRHSAVGGHRMCAMELIYFARPDSVIEGCGVHPFRKASGKLLYKEHPADADIVVGVPESSLSAAIGYAEASGLPLEMGLIKNMYVARTFIQPNQSMREVGVKMKLTPVRSIVKDKRVVVIDDSIVRGTTSRQIVRMLRDAGAKEVHFRIASPKYAWPCYYGIDTGTREQLIGARLNEEEICAWLGADSLYYLSEKALLEASGRSELCTACFSGQYPTDLYGYAPDAKSRPGRK